MNPTFLFATSSFWTRLNSLQSYVKSLTPITIQEDTKQLEILSQKIGENFNLTQNQNKELYNTLSTMYRSMEKGEKELHDYREEFKDTVKEITEIVNENNKVALAINNVFNDALFSTTLRYSDILRSNTIISLVSFFELLIGDLLHIYYLKKPMALSSNEKEFSFNDIKKFNSLEDFTESIRVRKVDGFLRNSIEEWGKFFSKNLKINFHELTHDWEQFYEVILRRNIIVHNDGKISKQYLQKVGYSDSNNCNINYEGKQLFVSEEYLINAIGQVLLVGMKLIYLTWEKLCPEEEGVRNSVLDKISYQLMLSGEWENAADILDFIKQNTDKTNLVNRFNYWLCMKKTGNFELVKDEINYFLTEGFSPAFELCYYGLMDEDTSFYKHLPIALQQGITKENIYNWPIFEDIRKDKNFQKAISIY